jgi:hypothetical protein
VVCVSKISQYLSLDTTETEQIDYIVIASLVGLFMYKSNKRSTASDILILPASAGLIWSTNQCGGRVVFSPISSLPPHLMVQLL